MRVNFPGLLIEAHRNGVPRYRVRVEGDKTRRIHIPVGPDHPDFAHHYHAARAGEAWQPPADKKQISDQSLDWLVTRYLDYLAKMVSAGQMSPATLKQRRSILTRLCDYLDGEGDRYGICDLDMDPAAFIEIRDSWANAPGAADNLIKTIRSVYSWAIERDLIKHNPAAGIGTINKNPKGGAIPWTAADLRKFREAHPPGTMAHLWLTIQAFTACRIGDAIWLGRDQEETINGQIWLKWQPRKKGSMPVTIPMTAQLIKATRAAKVIGPTYLLSETGKPFASSEALRVRVQRWCKAAGLEDRSSHGIRKAAAELMAESGSTDYQVAAVLSHTSTNTTNKSYTKGAKRRTLAAAGIATLEDWIV